MREKPRRAILFGLMLAATTALLSAQSNERIDELLTQTPAQIGHTAYLVLTAAGSIDESATPAQAIAAAQEAGWLPAGVTVDDPTRFGDFSYLLTGSFDVAGGVMYRLVPFTSTVRGVHDDAAQIGICSGCAASPGGIRRLRSGGPRLGWKPHDDEHRSVRAGGQ